MKECSLALKKLLEENQTFYPADLYTFVLETGTELRYTACDIPLTVGGKTYNILSIKRDGTHQTRGLEVGEVSLTIETYKDDIIPGGLTLLQGAVSGALDYAKVIIDRVFSPIPFQFNMPEISNDYVMNWWIGLCDIEEIGATTINIKVSSITQLLNIKFPRNLYYPSCSHVFGDKDCRVDLSKFKISGRITQIGTNSEIYTNFVSPYPNFLEQGYITFTSGTNSGVSRSIKKQDGGKLYLIFPLYSALAVGDLVEGYPGCNRSRDFCQNRFNNIARFRGYPYIPMPETAY